MAEIGGNKRQEKGSWGYSSAAQNLPGWHKVLQFNSQFQKKVKIRQCLVALTIHVQCFRMQPFWRGQGSEALWMAAVM